MSVAEIIKAMPEALNVEKAKGLNVIVGWSLSGDDPGDYTVSIADGKATITDGISDDAAATLSMDSSTFIGLQLGQVNPMTAFMTGKIKIEGDMGSVMKMQGIFQ
ncbi:MAG: SCP2 sterol-binding domain-containing protein [Chloroflexota bacterium]